MMNVVAGSESGVIDEVTDYTLRSVPLTCRVVCVRYCNRLHKGKK